MSEHKGPREFRDHKRRRGLTFWAGCAGGSWVALLYYALFGTWGAVAVAGIYTAGSVVLGAYVLGTEADDA